MITRNMQTFQLTGPDPQTGQFVTLAINDTRYFAMLTVLTAQEDASAANNAKRDSYAHALDSFQKLLDSGRSQGVSTPAKPTMTVVDDYGKTSEQPFSPALPDPVMPPPATPNMPLGGDPASRPPDPNVVLSLHTMLLQQILANQQELKQTLKLLAPFKPSGL